MKSKIRRWLPLVLVVLAALSLRTAITRPLWFDEALTLLNFVMLPRWSDIYWNYAIPNNHILFTLLLRGVAETMWMLGLGVLEFAWRSVSLIAAIVAVVIMYRTWKQRCGEIVTFLVLASLVMAPSFMIYATAVRGYMVGFLCVLLAFESARRFMSGRRIYLLWFSLASLAAVATIPTDILAVEAALLLVLPRRGGRDWWSWLTLAVIPPLMFLMFYLPLWPQLMRNMALKEGWGDGGRAALMVYVGFLLPLLPLVLVQLPGWCGGCAGNWRRLRFWGIVLLVAVPLLAIAVFHPYPFPRTFFVWWPLGLYLVAAGIHRWLAWLRRCRQLGRRTDWSIAAAVILIALAVFGLSPGVAKVSKWIIPGNELDDFFRPYYIVDYHPEETVGLTRDVAGWVYVSFGADPYPLMYYGLLQQMPAERWHFDGPRGRVSTLDGCGLVVLSRDDDPAATVTRFGLKALHPLKRNGYHVIYRPEGK